MKTITLYDISKANSHETSNAPFYCRTDHGNYYVKFMDVLTFINEIPWYKALINEYVGSEIAKLMGLPIPETALVKCDKEFSVTIDGQQIKITNSVNFGSKAIDGGTVLSLYTLEQLENIDNKNDLLSIMLFDAILHNVDRDGNNGNTLVEMGTTSHLYIIDHGRLFGAGEIWDKYSLKNDQRGETTIDPYLHSGIYSLFRESTCLKEQCEIASRKIKLVTREKLENIIYSIPKEWCLSSEDANALLEYLCNRFENGEKYLSLIINGGL